MEEAHKRRRLNSDSDSDSHSMNPPEVAQYLFEIGRICESTYALLYTLQSQVSNLQEKIKSVEAKSESMEHTISKMNASFLRELQQKDIEIATLKELNQNMIADYEKKMEVCESSTKREESYSSFYA